MKITAELLKRIAGARPDDVPVFEGLADGLNRLADIEARIAKAREAFEEAGRAHERARIAVNDAVAEARGECPHYTVNGNWACDVCGVVNPKGHEDANR